MVEEEMACRPCIPKTSISSVMLIVLLCIGAKEVKAQAGRLPDSEVQALKEIAAQLRKNDWNFKVNPCTDSSWITATSNGTSLYKSNSTLNCNCSFPDGVCHVINMFLKAQDLAGTLPPALAKLPYLKAVDFKRNYLSGTIPREWASMKLENLTLSANNLSGPIDYLGNITTLKSLSIESNLFSGPVPPELGNLVDLESLVLNANNFTGELPTNLTNLTKLRELRISSNNFIGRVPDFFQNWTQLQHLEMQATGFKGPIPSNISVLSNLVELRISDLTGHGSTFPTLQNMTSLEKLMLRSCNITGPIPPSISQLTALKVLDLSFNRLEGNIPDLGDIIKLATIYLTGNLLSGPIPEWIKSRDSRYQIDLSYNNFVERSAPDTCLDNINLFRSFPKSDNLILTECLKNSPCSKDNYKLHINCGGSATTIGDIKYEADLDPGGLAKFIRMNGDAWGFSSTGGFWDVNRTAKDFIAQNQSILRMNDSSLYMNARLSPLSLTYYARCLANGNYIVKLHFAEIIFRGNKSFRSLGRRMFDVYIQNVLVLKDFDIKKEAKGVDKAVVRNFTALVKNKTLEIRFYWAGKGTQDIPIRGIYGPLISAITIDAGFSPPDNGKKKIFLVGMAVLALFLVLITLGFLRWKGYLGGQKSREQELRGLDVQTGFFTYRQIKAATNDFDAANKLGEGGFGSVYKGILLDGTAIAVKQLSSKSKQGNREFVTEIGMISGLQHPNLVKLYGCCIERKQLLLVYEYMENNSLAHALFGPEEDPVKLDWHTRQKICVGIARGLAFLHDESPLKIVHRDIKTSNVLLDRDLNPKISDFGLAKLDEEGNTHISTRVAGTIGYMAPEYALWGYLTYKADVYSFGIVALEIVAGKNNIKFRPNEDFVCLLDWALVLQQKGNLMELVDPRLSSNFNKEEVIRIIKVALLCTNPSPALRPTMSAVVSMLKGRYVVHELIMDPSIYGDESRFQTLRDQFNQVLGTSSRDTQSLIQSSDATCIGSSTTLSS